MSAYIYPDVDELKTVRESNPTYSVWEAIATASVPATPLPVPGGVALFDENLDMWALGVDSNGSLFATKQ